MKFEKNNNYFTVATYVVITSIVIIIMALFIFNIRMVWKVGINLLVKIYSLLEPLIIGLVIAYLLEPLTHFYDKKIATHLFHKVSRVNNNTKKRWHTRTVPTLFSFVTLLVIITVGVLLIKINISEFSSGINFIDLKQSVEEYTDTFNQMINSLKDTLKSLGFYDQTISKIESFYDYINNIINAFANRIVEVIGSIGAHLMNWLLSIVIAFYLLQDKERLQAFATKLLKKLLNKKYHATYRFFQKVDTVLSGYIRGEILDSIIMTILTSIVLVFVKIDFAIIIGIIAGISNLIPYFGPFVGLILTVIIGILDENPMKALYGAIGIIVIQQIDGLVIVPNIVGDFVKLHPIVVLLVIVIGGNLFGIVGMLIAIPISALVRLVLEEFFPDLF